MYNMLQRFLPLLARRYSTPPLVGATGNRGRDDIWLGGRSSGAPSDWWLSCRHRSPSEMGLQPVHRHNLLTATNRQLKKLRGPLHHMERANVQRRQRQDRSAPPHVQVLCRQEFWRARCRHLGVGKRPRWRRLNTPQLLHKWFHWRR